MKKIIKVKSLNGYNGMALWPFIIVVKGKEDNKRLINHETIHLKQQVELLLIVFYILYFLCYGFNILKYRNVKKAYRNIPFEKEAYDNDDNLNYLDERKRFAWLKYF